jgi:hypothetical protein
VSADRTQQRGSMHTEGCPDQLTVRRAHRGTGRGTSAMVTTKHAAIDDGRWVVAELPARVGRVRERARGLGRGHK